ncbi:MAG: PKD domain-containing protein [Bacteroidia bacterium]|nr:PKD domain-containing protein [Bacteroidia bacterium]
MRYAAFFLALAWAQVTTLYFQNFNGSSTSSPPSGWQLNSTDMGAVTPPTSNNMWRIGPHYASQTVNVPIMCGGFLPLCVQIPAPASPIPNQPPNIVGAPNSEFMHVSFSGYQCCTPPPQPTASFTAAGNPGVGNETYFAKYAAGVNIPAGATNVRLTLFWICHGNAQAYGEVLYSTAGPNGPWTALTSSVTNSTMFYTPSGAWQQWRADTIPLPVTPPTTVYIGFRFVNQIGANNDPPFIVDDVGIIAVLASAPTISLTSVTPNPVCAGSPVTVSFTHSNFSGSPNFQVQLLDAGNNIVFTSAASGSSPISFTVPSTLASGTYSVRVVSGSVQSAAQSIQVTNLSSFTCLASATAITAGSAVTFTLNGGAGFPNAGALSVTFDPGDASGTVSLGPYTLPGQLPATYTHTYSNPGVYVAQFTANLNGCTQTCQQTITVTATPTLTLNSISHTQVCSGGNLLVNYTASGFPPSTQYTAQLLDASSNVVASASGASPITLTIPAATPSGNYTVQVQANTTPVTNSNTLTVSVINLSGFTLTCSVSPSPADAGSPVTLSVNLTPTPPIPLDVQVNAGDGSPPQTVSGTIAFPQSFTHTYTQSGSFTVTFTVSNSAPGCTLTCTQTLSVNPTITLGSVAASVCAGSSLSVPFNAVGFGSGTSFTAEVRNAANALVASATGTSSPISVSLPPTLPSGSYTVQVMAGATQSSPVSVEVINLNGFTCGASVTTITVGQAIVFTLTGTGLPTSGSLSVSFTPGDGGPAQNLSYSLPSGLPASVSYTYAAAGTYTATFTANYGGCSHTCTQTITVTPFTTPQIIIGTLASSICAGGGITVPFDAIGFSPNTTFTVEIAPVSSSTWTSLCTGTSSPISCILNETTPSGTYKLRIAGSPPTTLSQERTIEVIRMQGLTCSITPLPAYVGEPITLTLSGQDLPSGPFRIEWMPGHSLPSQTQNLSALPATLSYTYITEGVYVGQATVTHTASGCQGRCELSILVTSRASGGNPSSLIHVAPDGSSIRVEKDAAYVEVFDALGRNLYLGSGGANIPILRGTFYLLRLRIDDRIEIHRLYIP